MRRAFDEQLELLHSELMIMGAYCENAIASSAKSLLDNNSELASAVISLSEQIDEKERQIEQLCLKMLLQQQPVAKDLRMVSSALKMITDMERIGDQSADIAEIVQTARPQLDDKLPEIHDMAVAVIRMVNDSIDAFVKGDIGIAQSVIDYDDVVDASFVLLKERLITSLAVEKSNAGYFLDCLMIGKYLERIGDHAVNIAKWVKFSMIGKREE